MRTAVERLAAWTALAGGLVLLALVAMVCISIAGRALTGIGLRPIPGDYELVEVGVGFAVFAALPWCHLKRSHAAVDLLAPALSARTNRVIDALIDLLVLAIALLIAWRLAVGMLDKKSYLETTLILGFETWLGYAFAMAGATVFCIVALWRAAESLSGRAADRRAGDRSAGDRGAGGGA